MVLLAFSTLRPACGYPAWEKCPAASTCLARSYSGSWRLEMRTVKILFFCHLAALVFGLGGLLIALPHPELWSNNPFGVEVFNFGISYAGSLHILFGAATMLLFGLLVIGTRKTLIFFVVATTIPLSAELLGTSTGFPFGPYSYTSFLGFKVAG